MRVPDDALRNAPHDDALYPGQPAASHDDQTEPALLVTEPEYLVVRVAQPQVRLRDGSPGFLYLLRSLFERLLDLLPDLTQ